MNMVIYKLLSVPNKAIIHHTCRIEIMSYGFLLMKRKKYNTVYWG